jgi:small conductance mechanosensitive channel
MSDIIQSEDIHVLYTAFGESSINLEVRYWVPYETYYQYLNGISNGIKQIKSAFDKNDITIPFPIRTLDFGIKGGKSLAKSLNDQK